MATMVVEKHGKGWRYRLTIGTEDGKRIRPSKGGFKTKKEASIAGTKALADFNARGVQFTPTEMLFNEYLNEWLNSYCRQNLKPSTIENYEKKLRLHIRPVLGLHKLKDISPSHVQSIINDMFQNGYSRNTLVCVKGILSGCLEYAVDPLRYIESNPAVRIKLPSRRAIPKVPTRSAPHRYISQNEMSKILERFPEGTPSHIPLLLGYECGMRLGEAFGVEWQDVDFQNRKITISRQLLWDQRRHGWYITPPKYESVRTIDISESLVDVLKRSFEKQQKDKAYYGDQYIKIVKDNEGFVRESGEGEELHFVNLRQNGSGVYPRIMLHTAKVAKNSLKIDGFDFHSLRHTHATMLADSGAPLKYVQDRLGHKKASVTINIYQHSTEVSDERGRDILNSMFNHQDA